MTNPGSEVVLYPGTHHQGRGLQKPLMDIPIVNVVITVF
jgi:hypothetical protein